MLRLLILFSVLFAGTAFGQSYLTLYGTLDMGLAVNTSNVKAGSAFQAGSNFGLISGGQSDNRIGFKGGESLGGGTEVNFVLENTINLGNGTLDQGDRLFGRQAWLGIENKSLG